MKIFATVLAAIITVGVSAAAQAFCGFYVARADTSLFNRASQVVLVRDGQRTVITMANDFEGNVEDFAVVVPVPTFIERSQVNVGDKAVIDHLDAYTSPRLVEYFDPDPCMALRRLELSQDMAALPGRHDRSELHGRRIRHPDPVRGGEPRLDQVAERQRLPYTPRGRRGCRQLPETGHALLRRQG